jgi:hypothetical protein
VFSVIRGGNLFFVEIQGIRTDIDENRKSPVEHEAVGSGDL